MSCDELIKAIGEQACRQRDEILARAEEEARAILRGAEERRKGLIEDARARGAAAARVEASRLLSQARLAARREALAARYQVIEQALGALEAQLERLPETESYREILVLLLDEILAANLDPVTVRCRPQDRPAIEEYARGRGRAISVEEVVFPSGGVEAVTGPEGRIVSRNTLADRMERIRPLLLQAAGRLLFEPEVAGAGP